MILNYRRQWIVLELLLIQTVKLQISMPLFMPPPIPSPMLPQMYSFPPPQVRMPFPAQPPMAFQIVQIQESKKIKLQTTTEKIVKDNSREENTIGIAIPMSFPAPLQFAMQGYQSSAFCMARPRPSNCPSIQNQPLGEPLSVAQPRFLLPMRKARLYPRVWKEKTNDRPEYSNMCSSECSKKRRKRKKTGLPRIPLDRRTFDSEIDSDVFAKPVLSYISNDGDVKLEKPLSDDEAAELMDESKFSQRVQVVTSQDSDNKQSVKIISNIDNNVTGNSNNHRRRQILLSSGNSQNVLGEGKKELIFRPPSEKKISNLSVSFQIS